MAVAALAVVCSPALAQSPPTTVPASDQSEVVSQLEVVGRPPGPALWRVTRGGAEVDILGGLSPLPHSLQWNTVRVEHALSGASVVFLPINRPQISVLDAASMFFHQGLLKPRGSHVMEDDLSPALRARFERIRDSFHADPRRYQHWKPMVAGLVLLGDFWKAAGLSEDKPASTVARLARAAHAQVRRVGEFRAKPLFDGAAAMSDAQNQVCLSAALDEIEAESANAQAAALAWSVGDLAAVRAHSGSSVLDKCLEQYPSVQAMLSKGTDVAVTTINQALERPGRSLAVIDMKFLLQKDGVLDRLKAEGDQISVPMD